MDKRAPLRGLLYFNFNQSCDCFAAGTTNGFRVFNCEPFKQMVRRGHPRVLGRPSARGCWLP